MNRSKKIILSLLFLGSLLAAGLIIYSLMKPAATPEAQHQAGSIVTVEGTSACLPHKGDGPHTLECAIGLRTSNGYYSLRDLRAEYYSTEQVLLVTGKFESPDPESPYNTIGTIVVQSVQEK